MAASCCLGRRIRLRSAGPAQGDSDVGAYSYERSRGKLGGMTMSGFRYDRILASTALALILAAPIAAHAAPRGPAPKMAAVPAATPAAQAAPEAPAAATPATPDALPPEISIPAQPAAAPDPLASLDPADRVVAEKMRDLLAAKVDKIFASKKERTAVDTFYQNRNLAPLWLEKGVENARAKAVIARMKAADTEGLEINDYKAPSFADLSGPDAL